MITALSLLFLQAGQSAHAKEYVSELTEEEVCALCFFAGVSYQIDPITNRMRFEPCGLVKVHGEWKVMVAPPRYYGREGTR